MTAEAAALLNTPSRLRLLEQSGLSGTDSERTFGRVAPGDWVASAGMPEGNHTLTLDYDFE